MPFKKLLTLRRDNHGVADDLVRSVAMTPVGLAAALDAPARPGGSFKSSNDEAHEHRLDQPRDFDKPVQKSRVRPKGVHPASRERRAGKRSS